MTTKEALYEKESRMSDRIIQTCSNTRSFVYQCALLVLLYRMLQQVNGFINLKYSVCHNDFDMKNNNRNGNKRTNNGNGRKSSFCSQSHPLLISSRAINCYHTFQFKSMASSNYENDNHHHDDDPSPLLQDEKKNDTPNKNQDSRQSKKEMLFYDPESLEEIKQHADIVSVIESHNLPGFERQSSTRATALCPFHDDTNPSLSIDNNRGLYKCFSCGAGGDVFNFVREYRHLQNGGGSSKKMSFLQAVNLVIRDYLPPQLTSNNSAIQTILSSSYSQTPQQREKIRLNRIKMERIHLANAAACDFYSKALVSFPSSGAARNHLRMRGIHPSIVSTFALGYAPDAYYSQSIGNKSQVGWGQGSLVEKLKQLKFSPQEIIDAGLAIRLEKNDKYNKNDTNRNSINQSQRQKLQGVKNNQNDNVKESNISKTNNNDPTNTETEMDDYSILMDRFRGRLMIPIFDETGTKIIAFGGRHLENPMPQQILDTKKKTQNSIKTETTESKDSDKKNSKPSPKRKYVAAKYLNSPESLVFQKKNVLFGLHAAKKALNEQSLKASENPSTVTNDNEKKDTAQSASPLIIVEGYLDAITLYAADVKEVVASMGTALTSHQLEAAAECVNPRCSKFFHLSIV